MCFTNVSWALQDILSKYVYCINRTSYENFKLKFCTCALGTRTNFQLEILTINVISGIVNFREIILESSRNVGETTPRCYGKVGIMVTLGFWCNDFENIFGVQTILFKMTDEILQNLAAVQD